MINVELRSCIFCVCEMRADLLICGGDERGRRLFIYIHIHKQIKVRGPLFASSRVRACVHVN